MPEPQPELGPTLTSRYNDALIEHGRIAPSVLSCVRNAFPLPEIRSGLGVQAKKVLETFAKDNFLDHGLAEKRTFFLGDQQYEAAAVPMFQRSAFVYEINKEINSRKELTLPDPKKAFMMIDIARVRDMDFIQKEKTGDKAADYVLNIVAAKLNNIVDDLNNRLKVRNIKVIAGRYGGDEFVLGLVGDYSAEDLREIEKEIKYVVNKTEAFYQKPDKSFVVGSVSLKNDKTDVIEIPNDAYGKRIFEFYFKKGLILNEEEIETVKQFTNEDQFYRISQGQESVTEVPVVGQKIKDLCRYHKELEVPFAMAEWYDRQDPDRKMQEEVLRVVEEVFLDPMMEEKIHTISSFEKHMKQDGVDSLWSFDLKFVKEINDNLGFINGDKVIMALWQRIKDSINKEDMDKLVFARRGGTFVMALKKGYTLSKVSQNALLKIDSITYPGSGLHLGIGLHHQQGNDVYSAINMAEDNSYMKIIAETIRLKEKESLDSLLPENFMPEKRQVISPVELIRYFFQGKRAYERCTKALQLLHDKPEFKGEEFNELRSKLQTIADAKRKVLLA